MRHGPEQLGMCVDWAGESINSGQSPGVDTDIHASCIFHGL